VKPELSKRLRILASALSVLVLAAIVAVFWIYGRIRASLPQLDGNTRVAGLTAATRIERDSLGVPTLTATNRVDIARALGFVHAQDRFFEMDVWRRAAAGELSAIFGLKTLEHDRAMRLHGFRKLARATVAQLPPDERAVVDAYAAGVNAGLAALREKPFEYLLVRGTPQPWSPEDTILVSDAMLIDLQDDTGRYERTLTTLRDAFGEPGVAFFAPLLTPADAALDGTTAPLSPIPGSQVINVRAENATGWSPMSSSGIARWGHRAPPALDRLLPGSNAFALAGSHTATGAAMLASDMHLNLRVPNVWYRAAFRYPGHAITGLTLPGTPLMIAGSNGHVAWSFTNSYVDTGDLIAIDVNPISEDLYRAPGHEELLHVEHRRETIEVHGRPAETVEYSWTIWGPIVGHDEEHHALAYLWTGHDASATNLDLLHMEDAADVTAAAAVAHGTGMPAQNIVIADATGNIAWTIAGKIPRRVGYSGRLPVTFQFADRSWDGFAPAESIPVVSSVPRPSTKDIAAPDGRIWSANQRMVGGDALKLLGDGDYARPNRAAQIRDDLKPLEHANPRDLLSVQLDDRAFFLEPWHRLLLDTLSPEVTAQKEVRARLRGFVEKWEGRASIDAVSYPVVRRFRIAVYTRVYQPIFARCTAQDPNFNWSQLPLEQPLWALLREKPMHLLAAQYPSWNALLVAAVDDVIADLDHDGIRLPYATWGQRNRAEIRHPISYNLPWFLRAKLDMPADPLPGDNDMPRVQGPSFGASERFVVSPGHEDEGLCHLPCGQSGHPLSPYYRAGHEAWVKGEPTPFLPGKPEHTLTLEPK